MLSNLDKSTSTVPPPTPNHPFDQPTSYPGGKIPRNKAPFNQTNNCRQGKMAARPTTPASPKNAKIKSPVPGAPVYGCGEAIPPPPPLLLILSQLSVCLPNTDKPFFTEHVQLLFSQAQDVLNTSIAHYKMILRVIFDNSALVPQCSKSATGQPVTSLTSNYLCLQCPSILTEEERLSHGKKKAHRFCTCFGHRREKLPRPHR